MEMDRRLGILLLLVTALYAAGLTAAESELPDPDGRDADMSKPVQVFILLGQSNMLGFGKIGPAEKDGTLEHACREKGLYPYLVDGEGNWTVRKDVRNVRVMQKKGNMAVYNNEWMTIKGKIGPEIGIGHFLGNAIDAPVMILKSCIGNRSLGWDLLPPGSERVEVDGMVYAGYKDRPGKWEAVEGRGTATEPPPWLDKKGNPIDWYAGKQYDDDIANAKKVLADLGTYYPGAAEYEVAGFCWWQGDKDRYNPVHSGMYEQNLARLIRQLRKDFNAPNAKFVCATLGQTDRGTAKGNEKLILEAMFAVDGTSGRYPEFRGNVAAVYSNPLSRGGASNGHYGGNAETYMNVGEGMGKAMAEFFE